MVCWCVSSALGRSFEASDPRRPLLTGRVPGPSVLARGGAALHCPPGKFFCPPMNTFLKLDVFLPLCPFSPHGVAVFLAAHTDYVESRLL